MKAKTHDKPITVELHPDNPRDDTVDVTSLHWHVNGEWLAIGCYDARLRVIDRKGEMYLNVKDHRVRSYASFV